MTTATKLSQDQLLMYSQKAPEKASVLLRHEDGRILPAVEYKRGSGFWYPDGRVSSLNGIFDDVELVAIRHEGFFMNMVDYQNRNTGTGGRRADRMMEQQMRLEKARKNPPAAKKPELDTFQTDVERRRNSGIDTEQFMEPTKVVAAPPTPTPATDVFEEVRQGVFGDDDEDDFVSVADLQSKMHRKGELFICLRTSGQIVFPKLMSDLIGLSPFDMQLSQKKRMLRITIGTGPMMLPKSGKMSCSNLIRIMHELKGLDGDPAKTAIGRIVFQQPDPQHLVFIGTF